MFIATWFLIAQTWKWPTYFLDLLLKSMSYCGRNWRNVSIGMGWTFSASMKKWRRKRSRWHTFLHFRLVPIIRCGLDSKSPVSVLWPLPSVVRGEKPREMRLHFSRLSCCPVCDMLEWKLSVCLSEFCIQCCHVGTVKPAWWQNLHHRKQPMCAALAPLASHPCLFGKAVVKTSLAHNCLYLPLPAWLFCSDKISHSFYLTTV